MKPAFEILPACEEDLPGILAIYNHAIQHTTAIWNNALVDLDERQRWWRARVDAGFPVLVALKGVRVAGFASYAPFRAFEGYKATVELGVYVEEESRGEGIAVALLRALETHARAAGMHVMVGGIAADNGASIRLHRRHGFVETGRLPEVGRKFDRYLDLVFMQKILD